MKPLRWLRYKWAGRLRRQTCANCYRDGRTAIWFYVPDDVWASVMGEDQRVLCLPCFDRLAERCGVDYGGEIEIQGRGSWLVGIQAVAAVATSAALSSASARRPNIVRSA